MINGKIVDAWFRSNSMREVYFGYKVELDVGMDGTPGEKYTTGQGFLLIDREGNVNKHHVKLLSDIVMSFGVTYSWTQLVGRSCEVMFDPLNYAARQWPQIHAIKPADKPKGLVSTLSEDYHYDIVREEKPFLWRLGFWVGSIWALLKRKEWLLMYYDWHTKKFAIGYIDGYGHTEGQQNKRTLDAVRKLADQCGSKLVFRKKDA